MLAGKKKTFDLPETIDFSGIQAYLEIISKINKKNILHFQKNIYIFASEKT